MLPMQSINEAKRITEKLSADFEVQGNDWRTEETKKFLKRLDARQAELGITKEKAREAVKEFWSGNFPAALKLIWGNKVRTEKQNGAGGITSTITYTISGWGTYTETIDYSGFNTYVHKITLSLEDNPEPDFYLSSVYSCFCRRKGTDFVSDQRKADADAWKIRVAKIWNCLFVGFETRALPDVLGLYYCRMANPIEFKPVPTK